MKLFLTLALLVIIDVLAFYFYGVIKIDYYDTPPILIAGLTTVSTAINVLYVYLIVRHFNKKTQENCNFSSSKRERSLLSKTW